MLIWIQLAADRSLTTSDFIVLCLYSRFDLVVCVNGKHGPSFLKRFDYILLSLSFSR